jgi:hypothetical protein
MRSMDSILADEPSVQSLPESAEDIAPVGEGDEVKVDEGATPEKAETKAQPPTEKVADEEDDQDPDPKDYSVAGLRKALSAVRGDKRTMRKKWQETEKRVQEYERKLAMLEGELNAVRKQPQPAQEAQKPTDPDDEFYTLGPGKFAETREQRLERKIEEKLIETDRRAMRRVVQDYDEAEAAFVAAAQANPALAATWRASDDKVGFAYERGKELMELQKYGAGSVQDLRAKIRAELEAEIAQQRETAPTPTAHRAPAKPIPKSNASARGSGAGAPQAWSGPRPLEDIFRS